jgi:hypothetical protein
MNSRTEMPKSLLGPLNNMFNSSSGYLECPICKKPGFDRAALQDRTKLKRLRLLLDDILSLTEKTPSDKITVKKASNGKKRSISERKSSREYLPPLNSPPPDDLFTKQHAKHRQQEFLARQLKELLQLITGAQLDDIIDKFSLPNTTESKKNPVDLGMADRMSLVQPHFSKPLVNLSFDSGFGIGEKQDRFGNKVKATFIAHKPHGIVIEDNGSTQEIYVNHLGKKHGAYYCKLASGLVMFGSYFEDQCYGMWGFIHPDNSVESRNYGFELLKSKCG